MRAGVTALALVATAWVALLLAAPVLALKGLALVGREDSDVSWWVATLYQAAGRICHQQPERSFQWSGVPFPVCGRCVALYASGAVGAIAAAWAAWGARPWLGWPRRPLWAGAGRAEVTWLLASMSPAAVLFLLEWTIADPGTPARALGSLPLGLVVGWLAGRELAGTHR